MADSIPVGASAMRGLCTVLSCVLLSLGGCAEKRSSPPEPAPAASPAPAAEPAPTPQPAASPTPPPSTMASVPSAAPALSERAKIELLIRSFAESSAVFIRNDTEYPGAEAASHLRRKWAFAGNQIKTAKDFIEHLASKSSETGKPYQIKLPDGKVVDSKAWLLERLAEIESSPAAPAPGR